MKDNLNIHYDEEGDFFELTMGKPTVSYFEPLGKDLFRKVDTKTGKIKGFAIFNFKRIFSKQKSMNLSIPMKLKVVD
ncbi:MAG: hypothetical protein AABX39_04845 [Nanoarchaeota archaeon]